jgi:hypothetical protein
VVYSNRTSCPFPSCHASASGSVLRSGGMTMVGDMFNYGLKSKVDGLCSELSQLLAQQPFLPFPPSFQSQGGGQQQGGSVGVGSKEMYDVQDDGTVAGRKAVMGALSLYLDRQNQREAPRRQAEV